MYNSLCDDLRSYKELKTATVKLLNENMDSKLNKLKKDRIINSDIKSPDEYYKIIGCNLYNCIEDLADLSSTHIDSKNMSQNKLGPAIRNLDEIELYTLINNIDEISLDILYTKEINRFNITIFNKIYFMKGIEFIVENMIEGIKENPDELIKLAFEKSESDKNKADEIAKKWTTDLKRWKEKIDKNLHTFEDNYKQMVNDATNVTASINEMISTF